MQRNVACDQMSKQWPCNVPAVSRRDAVSTGEPRVSVTMVKSNNIRPCKLIRPFWQVAALISGAPFMHAVCSQLGNFPIQQSRGGHTFYMQLWHLSNAADTHTGCLPSQRGRLECRWQRWSPGDHCHNCCWDEPALPEISKHHS
jgi:hypothetical protein